MNLIHFARVLFFFQKQLIQLFLCQGLHMRGNVEFHFSPYLFSRVNVSSTRWGWPLIDFLLLIKFFCLLACMLWIIVLHEPVFAALELRLKEWQEMVRQNLIVNLYTHYLVKHGNFCRSPHGNACPNVNFECVWLVATITTVQLQLLQCNYCTCTLNVHTHTSK